MSETSAYKEFSGKDVDEAIEMACDFFNSQRERLEIEIVSGGSTGIFGLVGKKKAVIRARRRGRAALDPEMFPEAGTREEEPSPAGPAQAAPAAGPERAAGKMAAPRPETRPAQATEDRKSVV